MRSPTNIKEVQQLAGRLTALSRFLSYADDKTFHFFATLNKKEMFKWTNKCEEIFLNLKTFLPSPSFLTHPISDSPLYLYLYVTNQVMNLVLV